MNKYIENIKKLWNSDDNILYKALLEKKDWILKCFYFPICLDDLKDFETLLDGKLKFTRLYFNPKYIKKEKYEEYFNAFNERYRVLYLNNNEYCVPENEILIKANFQKISKQSYMELFANFFPCLDLNNVNLEEFTFDQQLLLLAMDKDLGDNVIILDKKYLHNNLYPLNILDSIIVNPKMNQGYVNVLNILKEQYNIDIKKANIC